MKRKVLKGPMLGKKTSNINEKGKTDKAVRGVIEVVRELD